MDKFPNEWCSKFYESHYCKKVGCPLQHIPMLITLCTLNDVASGCSRNINNRNRMHKPCKLIHKDEIEKLIRIYETYNFRPLEYNNFVNKYKEVISYIKLKCAPQELKLKNKPVQSITKSASISNPPTKKPIDSSHTVNNIKEYLLHKKTQTTPKPTALDEKIKNILSTTKNPKLKKLTDNTSSKKLLKSELDPPITPPPSHNCSKIIKNISNEEHSLLLNPIQSKGIDSLINNIQMTLNDTNSQPTVQTDSAIDAMIQEQLPYKKSSNYISLLKILKYLDIKFIINQETLKDPKYNQIGTAFSMFLQLYNISFNDLSTQQKIDLLHTQYITI